MEVKEVVAPILCQEKECRRCNHKLKKALTEIKGIANVEIDAAKLRLLFDPNILSFEQLQKKTKEVGCLLAEKFSHETLDLAGLDCPDCATKLERAVSRQSGVVWVSVNFASSTMGIEFEPDKISLSKVTKLIEDIGYQVVKTAPEAKVASWLFDKRLLATAASGILIGLGFLLSQLGYRALIVDLFYVFAILSGGYYIARGGFASLKTWTLDMNSLVILAVIAASAIGQWLEGALVLFLFSLGNALEALAMEKNRRSLHALIKESPKEALIRRDGQETIVAVDKISVGDIAIVKPGAKIPMDGIVLAGSSAVNQAKITGESLPMEKSAGDQVFAGTINGNGSLEVKVIKGADESILAKVAKLIERAQDQKAPAQLFTEKFGRIYSPAVIGLAAVTATVLPLFFGLPLARSIYLAAVFLVVSCPCALVISVPVAVVSSIANAAKQGVLIKGGVFLEAAGSLSVIAFDKTGTLTRGRHSVTDLIPIADIAQGQLLALAAALEGRSEHPLAKAIHAEALMKDLALETATDFQAFPGGGVRATINGVVYYLGSHHFFNSQGLQVANFKDMARKLETNSRTVLFLGSNNKILGIIALTDKLKADSGAVVKRLRALGIRSIHMLTGDNLSTAETIARELKLDDFHAELMPEDKVKVIQDLQARSGNVGMVGDGVNDAPALAAAAVGIAMGAVGTDIALETADIVLISDELSKLPYTMRLSRRALRIIRQNIVFSLGVMALLIVATLAGRLTLSLGVIGHEGSALLVIANGMRMLREVKN